MASFDRDFDSTSATQVARPVQRSAAGKYPGFLDLQRMAGNAAVSSMLSVQRTEEEEGEDEATEE